MSAVKLPPSSQQIPYFHNREVNIGWKISYVTSLLCFLFVWYFLFLSCFLYSFLFFKPLAQSCWILNSFRCHLTGNLFLFKSTARSVLYNFWSFLCVITNESTFSCGWESLSLWVYALAHCIPYMSACVCTWLVWRRGSTLGTSEGVTSWSRRCSMQCEQAQTILPSVAF